MTRKEFLKLSLLLSGGWMMPQTLWSCMREEEFEVEDWALPYKGALNEDIVAQESFQDKKIIVVGAGIAGLAAAARLKKYGFQVLILEARDRIGGRIWTDRSWSIAADIGAAWIHGPKGNPVTAIADHAKLMRYRTDDDSLIVYDENGKEIPEKVMDAYYEAYEKLLASVEQNASAGISLKDAIGRIDKSHLEDLKMLYQLSAYAEFDTGGAIEDLDAYYWQDDKSYPGADVLFPNGYDAVINFLAADLDIRRNQIVKSIDYQDSKVKIHTQDSNFEADYAVITLPLGVLKKNVVTFNPSLPAQKLAAINRLKMGVVNKVFLQFSRQFWDKQQYIGYTSPIKGMYNYFLNANTFLPNSNILVTFGLGSYGAILEKKSDEQIVDEVVGILKKIYKDVPPPERVLVSRWGQDEFSQGAYSFVHVGASSKDFDVLSESVMGKLFFAGEHTSRDFRGTVHGAFASGQREADKIAKL